MHIGFVCAGKQAHKRSPQKTRRTSRQSEEVRQSNLKSAKSESSIAAGRIDCFGAALTNQNHFFHLKIASGTITLIAMTVSAIA
jgi:hypothetical protein